MKKNQQAKQVNNKTNKGAELSVMSKIQRKRALKERRKEGKQGKLFTRRMDFIETKFQPFHKQRQRNT